MTVRSVRDARRMSLGTLTTRHPRWVEFIERLSGPEACDVREGADGNITWRCSARTREYAAAILRDMGASDGDLLATLDYFDEHGGHCDCEIWLNVDAPLHDDASS
jgi:hypothetical protein